MKQCPWCAQEMPDAATVCPHCGPGAGLPIAHEATPVEYDTDQMLPMPPPVAVAPAAGAGINRSHLIAIVASVVGAGTVTFAMLVSGGSSTASAGTGVELRTLERPAVTAP